jgi:tripartite-type tricarboxylate transporter receptor subunit TctC
MPAHAQTNWPARPVHLIVPYPPGGGTDYFARLVGGAMEKLLGQPVIVENRPGAATIIGAEVVARAAPDGYTLLATTTALAINETLFANKPFTAADFKTVAIAASSPEALVTAASNPANNLDDFLKTMKGKTINFAVPGVGTGSHIEAEYFFKVLAKAPAQMIPFQGGAPAISATIGGQVDLMATTLGGGAAAQIISGKLKGLGIAADKRAVVVPDVPTYAEQGFPGFTAASWVGFFAPAKTDPQIVTALNSAINDIVKSQAVAAKLTDMGFEPITGSAAEADAMFNAEVKKWGGMVKTLGLAIQ